MGLYYCKKTHLKPQPPVKNPGSKLGRFHDMPQNKTQKTASIFPCCFFPPFTFSHRKNFTNNLDLHLWCLGKKIWNPKWWWKMVMVTMGSQSLKKFGPPPKKKKKKRKIQDKNTELAPWEHPCGEFMKMHGLHLDLAWREGEAALSNKARMFFFGKGLLLGKLKGKHGYIT